MNGNRWLASARFDLALILGPPIAAVLLVAAFPMFRTVDTPLWGWLVFVVFIDVAHVYSSLYRTYLDRTELARRPVLYFVVPPACLLAGFVLYNLGPLVFWRVLAYLAVFHFVRQQYGFVMLYRHRVGEKGKGDAWIDKIAIYAAMLYPLVFWHAAGDRNFAWFIPGDFVALPAVASTVALVAYSSAILLFAARQIQRAATGHPLNWGKIGIVGSTAAVWYLGIVHLNSDFAFTVTNIVAHGVPYFALVWLYGRRRWEGDGSWRGTLHRPIGVGLFVGFLVALAYFEEGIWDLFVWNQHSAVFGGLQFGAAVPEFALSILVPLLVVPQATHYVLDAFIWKFDGSNPGIRYYLFREGERPA